jgi:hypothetical protein
MLSAPLRKRRRSPAAFVGNQCSGHKSIEGLKDLQHDPVLADRYIAGEFGVEIHVWLRAGGYGIGGQYWIAYLCVSRRFARRGPR